MRGDYCSESVSAVANLIIQNICTFTHVKTRTRLDEEAEELRAPAGELCFSYRAEMVALVTGPETLLGRDRDQDLRSVPIC